VQEAKARVSQGPGTSALRPQEIKFSKKNSVLSKSLDCAKTLHKAEPPEMVHSHDIARQV